MGTPPSPSNEDSKGCGTIMRIAPCALLPTGDGAFELGRLCWAITHGHLTGYLAGAAFAETLGRILVGEDLSSAIGATLCLLESTDSGEEATTITQLVLDLQTADLPYYERVTRLETYRGDGVDSRT